MDITTGNVDASSQISVPYATFPFPRKAPLTKTEKYYLAGATSTLLAVVDLATKTITKQLAIPQTAEPKASR